MNNLQLSEFYSAYANLPIEKRDQVLDFGRFGVYRMKDVYFEIDTFQELRRKENERLETLLAIAEEFMPKLREKS